MADPTKQATITAKLEDVETRLSVYFTRSVGGELTLKFNANFHQESSDGSKVAPAMVSGQLAQPDLVAAFEAAVNAAMATKGF